jgi:hypothetical protein
MTPLIDLIEALHDCALSDDELVTTVVSLIHRGTVRLGSIFTGARIAVSPATCFAPPSFTLPPGRTEGNRPSAVALSLAFAASSPVKSPRGGGKKGAVRRWSVLQPFVQKTHHVRGPFRTAILRNSSPSARGDRPYRCCGVHRHTCSLGRRVIGDQSRDSSGTVVAVRENLWRLLIGVDWDNDFLVPVFLGEIHLQCEDREILPQEAQSSARR